MSADQTRRTLNQLLKELAGFEKKLAEYAKNESSKMKRINDIKRSITKNTSVSTTQSKLRQIATLNSDLAKIASSKADISKRIVDKRNRINDATIKLQREEAAEAKKLQREQQNIYNNYEKKIANLTAKLDTVTAKQQIDPDEIDIYNSNGNEVYDVFISHASEDKESFADELCQILSDEYKMKVWYDDISVKWGDSLRSKIDNGLKQSKFGILVLSRYYIKKGWTQYELDGLFQRERTNGKIILPIWHNITKDEVADFSPTLAGRKALNTALFTVKEIAEQLKDLLVD